MLSIDFTLRPLETVVPWGEPDNPNLSWFGLTDGSYHLDVTGGRLFQYTPQILDFLAREHSIQGRMDDCADYQVVRLYEDLLELLPNVIVPVPSEIHALVSNVEARRNWQDKLSSAIVVDDDEALNALYFQATEWFGYRKLDTLYLTDGPDIWFWRFRNDIFIQWDNAGKKTDGIPRWTAGEGICSVPIEVFLNELTVFHLRFMSEMAERVGTIQNKNPLPHVRIDVPSLIREHSKRTRSLALAMSAPPQSIDWDLTMEANQKLARGALD